MKRWRKGSLTVEAAGIMGVVLLVIFFLLYAEFYVMNRNWLTISAYEAAVTGSMEEVRREGNGWSSARERAQMLGNTGFFGLSDLHLQVSCDSSVKVVYSGKMKTLMGNSSAGLTCAGEYAVICPSERIRRIRLAERGAAE